MSETHKSPGFDVILACHSNDIKQLQEKVRELEKTVTKLQMECQRLYRTGFSNGVEVAKTEYGNELKRLEAEGLVTFHGFLAPKNK